MEKCMFQLWKFLCLLLATGSALATQIVSTELMELGGRPGHQGYWPMEVGQPTSDKVLVLVTFLGEPQSAELQVMGGSSVLFQLPLTQADGQRFLYLANITIPNVPFNLAVVGVDEYGEPFSNMEDKTFNKSTIGVAIGTEDSYIARGDALEFEVILDNMGANDSFTLTVTNSLFLTPVDHSQHITLENGMQKTVTFQLLIPPSIEELENLELRAEIVSESNSDNTNTALSNITILDKADITTSIPEEESICFPLKLESGGVSVICL